MSDLCYQKLSPQAESWTPKTRFSHFASVPGTHRGLHQAKRHMACSKLQLLCSCASLHWSFCNPWKDHGKTKLDTQRTQALPQRSYINLSVIDLLWPSLNELRQDRLRIVGRQKAKSDPSGISTRFVRDRKTLGLHHSYCAIVML